MHRILFYSPFRIIKLNLKMLFLGEYHLKFSLLNLQKKPKQLNLKR